MGALAWMFAEWMADKKPTTKTRPKSSYTSFQDTAPLSNKPLTMGFLYLMVTYVIFGTCLFTGLAR